MIVYELPPRAPEPLGLEALEVGEVKFFSNYETSIHRIYGTIGQIKNRTRMRFTVERVVRDGGPDGDPIVGYEVCRVR